MKSLSLFSSFLLLSCFAGLVLSVPLGATVKRKVFTSKEKSRLRDAGLGHKSEASLRYNVHKAVDHAHDQIQNMRHVLNNAHTDRNKEILAKSFGPHYHEHLDDIRAKTEQLHNAHLKISNAHFAYHKGDNTLGHTSQPSGKIYLGAAFHKLPEYKRTGTLIHEASHSLFKTKDNHRIEAKPGGGTQLVPAMAKDAARDPAHHVSGYIGDDIHRVHQELTHPTMNADNWKLFGFHATYGRTVDYETGRRPSPTPEPQTKRQRVE